MSLKFELQNYWSSWDFTFMMYKSNWKQIFTQILAPNGFFCDRLCLWISKLVRDAAFKQQPWDLPCWLKKVTYFEEFEINSHFCSKTQWQIFLLVSEHVSIQISINLGKTFLCISCLKIAVTWILAEYLHIYLLSFLRFWTLSIEQFWFLFWSALTGITLKTSNLLSR